MGRNPNKRQKTSRGYAEPLGSRSAINDEEAKDDEELQLEASLFGTKPPKSKNSKFSTPNLNGETEVGDLEATNEFEQLEDSDVSCTFNFVQEVQRLRMIGFKFIYAVILH